MAEPPNPSNLSTTTTTATETMTERNEDAPPEPVEDRRPFGFGPCSVCKTNKICVLFNCRHLTCCNRCANECSLCPKCGRTVTERHHVYEPS